MTTIIACSNNKGGSGKTCCSVTLAHALGNRGKKVLVCDLDTQCNSTSLLLRQGDNPRNSLYELLSSEADAPSCIYASKYENVDVLPNVEEVAALEFSLIKDAERNLTLFRDKISSYIENKYDFVMLDCPPNLGFWTMGALITANLVISPTVSGSGFSLDGLLRTIKLIQDIQQQTNPSLRFFRLLINNVDKRTTMGKVTLAQLVDKLGQDMIFATTIPASSQFQQAEHLRETVLRSNSKSPAAKAYRALAQEILELVEG
ncbi:ParA family protein [Solidesulfovibrio magneticus]|uniref:Chromosome partitioning protein ParA n=1 Tax=Solidesulfovibrio magneticus (strain ATCC 700980 / DSM 13731 / RS-1) TaxID=573370 RepID=C4XUN1_SOLM1|nr:AAA family ATPase [Solidesulfovibrio magneticus]BAH73482.1 putative chromosome partitioning protein ParA [Solidesulfovibrio magneticus RS-1]